MGLPLSVSDPNLGKSLSDRVQAPGDVIGSGTASHAILGISWKALCHDDWTLDGPANEAVIGPKLIRIVMTPTVTQSPISCGTSELSAPKGTVLPGSNILM